MIIKVVAWGIYNLFVNLQKDAVVKLIQGKEHDLGGGMLVRRVLPQVAKRSVGPFIFLDHMGPVQIAADQNTDVRPHPHIGLSTLTYLFSGRIIHRDSLGSLASIEPGEVNWMTAGKGISHSERTAPEDRKHPHEMHGLQFWIALPDDQEDCDPSFQHYNQQSIPKIENEIAEIKVIAGSGFGMVSDVRTTSPLVLIEIKTKQDFEFDFAEFKFEVAVYMIKGDGKFESETENHSVHSLEMMLIEDLDKNKKMKISAGSHFIIMGGEPIQTPRHMWWNLVSSSKDKIEQAKLNWKNKTFPMVPGETEFIPLPEK